MSIVAKFVVMSRSGHKTTAASVPGLALMKLHTLGVHLAAAPKRAVRLLESRKETGIKLVEMTPEAAAQMAKAQPDLIVAPLRYYAHPRRPVPKPRKAKTMSVVAGKCKVQVVDAGTQAALAGMKVYAFTDFDNRIGDIGTTNANGQATLDIVAGTVIEKLLVLPPLAGYWGLHLENVALTNPMTLSVLAVDPAQNDAIDHFHRAGKGTGKGVRVAIIDTGVGPHPDLVYTGDDDNGEGHGSHCAGIVASRGKRPGGKPGIAPEAEIMSYRVFPLNGVAANFTVASAIDQAIDDGCDLLNLSLGFDGMDEDDFDPVIRESIKDAVDNGALVFVAAGNDDRGPVGYPATEKDAIAISAVGRVGTFPADSFASLDIADPRGSKDKKVFAASFTNIGSKIALAGAGCGIVSTVPGGYGVMSGTSMATPAIVGMAARILSASPTILNAPRNRKRALALLTALKKRAKKLGLGLKIEGAGIVR